MPAGALVGEIVVPTSEGTNETLSMLFDSGSRFTWVPGPRGHVRPDGSFLPTDVNGQRPEIVDYVTGEVKFQSASIARIRYHRRILRSLQMMPLDSICFLVRANFDFLK